MRLKMLVLPSFLVALLAIFVCSRPSGNLVGQDQLKWSLFTEADPVAIDAGPFLSVFFFDKNNGIAISPITIDKTIDGGTNWSAVQNWDENNRGFSSLVSANGQLWIVGSENNRPFILTTINQGFTWEDWNKVDFVGGGLERRKEFTKFTDLCFDQSGSAWAVGDGGVVQLRPDDKDMQVLSIIGSKDILYSISCDSSGHVWAAGENNTVLRYHDGWKRIESGKLATFWKVVAYEKETWLLGEENPSNEKNLRKGILLRSKNGGQTWEDVTPESANVLRDISISGEGGWLVGDGGSLYSTKDRGTSWNKEKSPTQNNLFSIFFLDSQNVWVVGDRASVIKYQNFSELQPPRNNVW